MTYFDEALSEAILSWPKDVQARFFRITERMQIAGPDIGMPHTRARELEQGYRKMREVLDAEP